jgi:hypothetical protein
MINSISPSNKELEILKIPPKTTSMIQHLDENDLDYGRIL